MRGATGLVLALLAATAFAFVATERKKLAPSPIAATDVPAVLAPRCRCPTSIAAVGFRVRRPGRVTVEIVDASGSPVRTLARDRAVGTELVRLDWNGRGDGGSLVSDGDYRMRLRLARGGRTFVDPNTIRLDTVPPRVTLLRLRPKNLVPGRRLSASFRLSERARPLLFVDGRRRVRGKFLRLTQSLAWYGRVAGRPVRRGRHVVQLAARDVAGNLGPLTRPVTIRIR